MPTEVYLSNGTLLTTVADQSIDSSTTSIALIGFGAINYSEAIAETFVHVMENFSAASPPKNPLAGQLWFNSSTKVLNLYSGSQWMNIGGAANNAVTVPGGAGIFTIAGNPTAANRFAGSIGVAVNYNNANTTVVMTICEGKIVTVTSAETIPVTALPATVTINGSSYPLQARFPAGFSAGVTLATDSEGYVFSGKSTASAFG